MTLLTCINKVQAVLNLAQTSTVITSQVEGVKQLLNLANIEGEETADEYGWQALLTETTFLTTATEQQTNGALPADLGWIIDETLYNRDATQKVRGPIGSREWQDQKTFGTAGADSQFRVKGGYFYFLPEPIAGQNVYYEYVSSKWCQSSGGTPQSAWAADTDVLRAWPERITTLGIIWRWKAAKGLDFTQDYNTWEGARSRAAARDGARRKLSAAGPSPRRLWNGRIREGSWA